MKPSVVAQSLKTLVTLKQPGFIWGAPGIGKSDLVRQVAAELKLEVVDKRLAQCDPTELKGYPVPDVKAGVMKFLRDATLPTKGKGILFLDELPHAPNAVQAVAFQLALDRRIGEYELPAGWTVIAAGNRTSDRSGANTINFALANRFVHLDMDVDTDDWVDWALKNGISDMTRGYIRYRPENLVTKEIKTGARELPTPRSWAFADRLVGSNLDEDTLQAMLSGTIGNGAAIEYMGYRREHASLVSVDRILLDPEKAPVPEKFSTLYAVSAALESRTTSGNLDRLMKYIKRMPKEFQVVYVQSITRSQEDVVETKAYIDWVRENRALLA